MEEEKKLEYIRKRLDEFSEEEKKEIFRNFGWSGVLVDKENKLPSEDYPLIHFKIFWDEKDNEKFLKEVNYYLDGCKAEDISVFTNDYNVSECHNASVGMRDDSSFIEFLNKNTNAVVIFDDDEEVEILKKHGLKLKHEGLYSVIGKIKDGKFVSNPVYDISLKEFINWLEIQDRFYLLDNQGDWLSIKECCNLIKKAKDINVVKSKKKLENVI